MENSQYFLQRIKSLESRLDGLEKENRKLTKQVSFLLKENKELKKKLYLYGNPHTPPSMKLRKRKPREPSGKIGAPAGHEGTTRPQPEPDKVVDVVPLKKCPNCMSRFGKPDGINETLIEDIPEPQPIFITLFRFPYHQCKNCGFFSSPSHPDCPKQGRFGFNLSGHVSLLKFDGRLPHRKIVEALKRDFDLKITSSTVMEINRRNAGKLSHEHQRMILRVKKAKFAYVDETGLKVNGAKYWVWIFITNKDVLVVIRPSRGKNVLTEILGKKFEGIIICDGWKTYPNFTMKIQRCWAHLLREVKDVCGKNPKFLPLYQKIKKLYGSLVENYREKMSEEKRQKLFKSSMKKLKKIIALKTRKTAVQKVIQKIQNGIKHWFTFILHPEIEPTNNTAERGLREIVVQRKIIGCLRNEKGTTTMEIIMSLFSTWKMTGKNLKTELLKNLRS